VRLGLGPIALAGTTRARLQALAEAAVTASFDSVWVAESRAAGVGGGLAAAAFLAQLVPIRVGAVVDGGLYHPLHMAEDIAIADLTSRGRIEVLLRSAPEEHLRLLLAALSGAHLRIDGPSLRVPARLEANQPSPDALALNPRPAQPVVPLWTDESSEAAGRDLGVGVAAAWRSGTRAPAPSGRWPGMLLCPGEVTGEDLLRASGAEAAYFLVEASSPEDVRDAGRRLGGPLRMPGFPDWINQQSTSVRLPELAVLS
jgi:hypothetical protein